LLSVLGIKKALNRGVMIISRGDGKGVSEDLGGKERYGRREPFGNSEGKRMRLLWFEDNLYTQKGKKKRKQKSLKKKIEKRSWKGEDNSISLKEVFRAG